MRKTDIKCKVTNGIRVCRVSTPSGRELRLNSAASMHPVDIKLFTSSDCHWCKGVDQKLRSVASRLPGMINLDVIDVQSDRFTKERNIRVDALPTVTIGKNTIVGDVEDDQLWMHIYNEYQRRGSEAVQS